MLHEDLLLADQVEGHACIYIYIYVDVNVNFLRQGRNRYIVRIYLHVCMVASRNSVLLTLYKNLSDTKISIKMSNTNMLKYKINKSNTKIIKNSQSNTTVYRNWNNNNYISHDREDSILSARMLSSICLSTLTSVSQVTGFLPLPRIHCCKISRLMEVALF